ncbi:MAG: FAD-binding oxidoreductase [archaeon]
MIDWVKRNIGEEFVSDEEASKIVYESDASQIEGKAVMVIRPDNVKEIHHLLLFIRRSNMSLTIRGGGTGLVGGAVPENSIVLDMSRMNRILEIGNDYVIVEPGVVLDDLNKKLGNKLFPVIPSSSKACTIGGMIACNAVGTKAVKYGRTENWVKEVYLLDGEGRTRKADLKDVLGKEGVTGIIISAKLKITDKPKAVKVEIFEFDDLKDLILRVRSLENINAAEFINKRASRLVGMRYKNHLLIERDSDVNENLELLEKRNGWYPEIARAGYPLIEDPKIPLDKMYEFLTWLEERDIPAFGHIMAGIIHPCFTDDKRLENLYEKVFKLNGEITGEHGIGIRKKAYTNKEFRDKIKKLKSLYDKDELINRGKLI